MAAGRVNARRRLPIRSLPGIDLRATRVKPGRNRLGGCAMTKFLPGAFAALALAAFAGAAQARDVCQWTGVDWACGDGNVVTRHVPPSGNLNMPIVAVPTAPPNERPLLSGPRPQR